MDIYTHNSYYNTYFAVVNKAFSECRSRKDSRIYEQHHIIPKSCGGSNEPENLVLLTPKEHYICHRLLPKMMKSKLHSEKMIYALWSLVNGNGKSKRYSPSGKVYQQIKEEQSSIRSERMKGEGNHFFGKTHSEEVKEWLSENNPSKRTDVSQKISISAKERYKRGYKNHNAINGWSDETKKKLSQANLGKTPSNETRRKMGITRSDKLWVKKEGEKSRHIQSNEIEIYLSLGWERGRTLGPRKKKFLYTEQQKKSLSNKLSNRVWICKSNESSKHIDYDDLPLYESQGWVRGRKIKPI